MLQDTYQTTDGLWSHVSDMLGRVKDVHILVNRKRPEQVSGRTEEATVAGAIPVDRKCDCS